MADSKNATGIYHVIGGGTISHIRSHFALTATAYGSTARKIHNLLQDKNLNTELHLTKMASAGKSDLETNDDIAGLVDDIIKNPSSKAIFFNPAIVDFHGKMGDIESGKYAERLKSRDAQQASLTLTASDKIVSRIKKMRPDILLIAFKTTTHANLAEQTKRGQSLQQGTNADFILANDTGTRRNLIINARGDVIFDTTDREKALNFLVKQSCVPTPKNTPKIKNKGNKPNV